MKTIFAVLLATLACGLTGSGLRAQTVLLDFGTNPINAANANNAPYSAGFTTAAWNTSIIGNETGLVYATGGSGATLTFGTLQNVAGSTTVDFNAGTVAGNGGTPAGSGPYASTASPGTGFVFQNNVSNVSYTALGLSIGGLAAGTYDIYLAGGNTNKIDAGTSAPEAFWATTSATAPTTIDFSTLGTAAIASNDATASPLAWTQGTNYVKLTVTLSAGQYLNIVETGDHRITGSSADERAFLNAVEIVSVPEPPAAVLLGAGLLGVVACAARRARATGAA